MKTKILCAILTIALLFSLAACGADKAAETTEDMSGVETQSIPEPNEGAHIDSISLDEALEPTYTIPPDLVTSQDMSPEYLTGFYKSVDHNQYVYSADLTTRASIVGDGTISYNYASNRALNPDFPAAPIWETTETSKWVNLTDPKSYDFGSTTAYTNVYPDLPDGNLNSIEADGELLKSQHYPDVGTLFIYPNVAYLYRNGVEINCWDLELQDSCLIPRRGYHFYDGNGRLISLNEDNTTSTISGYVTDALLEDLVNLNALVVQDGALVLYYQNYDKTARGESVLKSVTIVDHGVKDARFVRYQGIWYVGNDGVAYALDHVDYSNDGDTHTDDDYYALKNEDCIPIFIRLGGESLDYYQQALDDYYDRTDIAKEDLSIQDFYNRVATGEY